MKIVPSTDKPAVAAPPAPTTPPAAAKTQPGPAAAATADASKASVAVTVSSRARALEQTKETQTADVDTAKVDSVRAAIADGTYVVNPGVIADKLLANAKEMLSRTTI
jgi:negative regulator of flagellin synthesis FlgM